MRRRRLVRRVRVNLHSSQLLEAILHALHEPRHLILQTPEARAEVGHSVRFRRHEAATAARGRRRGNRASRRQLPGHVLAAVQHLRGEVDG